jgi:hypothetical protein
MQRFLPALQPRTWLILASFLVLAGLLLPLDVIHGQGLLEGEGPIRRFLFGVIINLTGWFLWLGGAILDYGVNAFVINFGTNFNQNGVGVAVNQLWVIVRDFFNILFIFGLVYIGFKMILNSDDSQTKKTLVYLIMAALLINFSLFITKFVVDFTNVLAGEVAVAGFAAAVGGGTEIDGNARNEVAIGDTFFRLMGIQQNVLLTPVGVESNQTSPWSYIFGVGIINIIGAFAFGVGGIMLVIRFVALSVYMVLSPFMFLGWIFPGFQSMSSKYWSGFLKQAFYAPVYIVMIFFAATILNNFFANETGSFQNARLGDLAGTEGLFGADGGQQVVFGAGLAPFILSAAFLIAAVQVAGKLSADGSTVMAKVGGAVQSRVRGAIRGTGRFAARNTLGYGALGAGLVADKGRQRLNRRLGNMAQGGAVKKWGARTLDRTVGSGLDVASGARIAGSETIAEYRKRVPEQNAKFNTTKAAMDREDAIAAFLKNPEDDEKKAKARGAVGKLTDDEVKNLSTKRRSDENLIGLLSEVQLKTLSESGNINNEEGKNIKNTHEKLKFKDFDEVLNKLSASAKEVDEAMDGLGKAVSRLAGDTLTGTSFNRLNTEGVASQLSEKQLETLKESGKLTTGQFDELTKTRSQGITNIISRGRVDAETKDDKGKVTGRSTPTITGDSTAVSKTVKAQRNKYIKNNSETIGKLPVEAFFKDGDVNGELTDVGKNITVDMMKAIGRATEQGKSDMTGDERQALAIAVSNNKRTYSSQMSTYLKTNKAREHFLVEAKDLGVNNTSWSDPVI